MHLSSLTHHFSSSYKVYFRYDKRNRKRNDTNIYFLPELVADMTHKKGTSKNRISCSVLLVLPVKYFDEGISKKIWEISPPSFISLIVRRRASGYPFRVELVEIQQIRSYVILMKIYINRFFRSHYRDIVYVQNV